MLMILNFENSLDFLEWSDRFIAFIDEYATSLFDNNFEFSDKCKKDNSEFLEKWKKNNGEGNDKVLQTLSKFICVKDLDVEYLANNIPKLKEDLDKYFTNVYEFVRREFENYKHYAKTIKYSEAITEIEKEKIEKIKGYRITKYDKSVSYDE